MSLAMPHQLVGVGLATPPRKKIPTATNKIRGRGWGRGYRRRRASGHGPDSSMLGGPTVQTSRVPRHHRGLPTGMTDAGESLREPCVLRGAGGPPSPTSDFGGAGGAADVAPTCWTAPGVNLRRVLRVGSCGCP